MSKPSKTPASLALSGALVGGLMLSGSAFAMQALPQGYQLAATAPAEPAVDKATEGKCGEGKCGADMKDKAGAAAHADHAADHADKAGHTEGKCGEGKCGADMQKDKAKAGAAADAGATDKSKAAHAEGKCGEGKCGGSR